MREREREIQGDAHLSTESHLDADDLRSGDDEHSLTRSHSLGRLVVWAGRRLHRLSTQQTPAERSPRAMSSSLAAQLEQRQTLDAARLQSARALKHPPTFVFTPRHATSVSTADLHALAHNAWDQLAALDPFFAAHFKEILGEHAKTLDRTALTREENDKVGRTVDRVLRALGKHMLLKPAGIVLEWLVRRFRCARRHSRSHVNTVALMRYPTGSRTSMSRA